MFSDNEILRYSRHFNLSEVGLLGQEKLKKASVLCIGAGGLGCSILQYLAAVGLGRIGILDHDIVDLTNLQRQVLYGTDNIGHKKILVCKQKLSQLNPNIVIEIYDEILNEDNAIKYISNYDIVADCTDNYTARYLINDACMQLKKPNVFASISQFEGLCTIFPGNKGPCYRCLFEVPPPSNLMPNCAEGGVLGVLPGLLGTIQALEALKYILGIGEPLIKKLLRVDALTLQFQQFEMHKNPNCAICTYHIPFEELNRKFNSCNSKTFDTSIIQLTPQEIIKLKQESQVFFLDVRERSEHANYNLGGQNIPLNEIQHRITEIDKNKKTIVYCSAGFRSQQAIRQLQALGFENLFNLKGGILAYTKEAQHKFN